MRQATIAHGKNCRHELVGENILYCDSVWKVVKAHSGVTHGTPWLTLRKGTAKALVKEDEVEVLRD